MRQHLNDEESWDSNTWDLEREELEDTVTFNDGCYQTSVVNIANFE